MLFHRKATVCLKYFGQDCRYDLKFLWSFNTSSGFILPSLNSFNKSINFWQLLQPFRLIPLVLSQYIKLLRSFFWVWNSKDFSSISYCFPSGIPSLSILKSFLISSLDWTNCFPCFSSDFICFFSLLFNCFCLFFKSFSKNRIYKLSLFYCLSLIRRQYFFTCKIFIFINFFQTMLKFLLLLC